MRILGRLRRLDLRQARFERPQKAVFKLLFNGLIRLSGWLVLVALVWAAVLAPNGILPPRAGWNPAAQAGWVLPAGWMQAVLAVLAITAALILLLRRVNPPTTAFILRNRAARRRAGQDDAVAHCWVPLSEIHPYLGLAAIGYEDPDFPVHNGFAFRRMLIAWWENRGRDFRLGASTITQQLAKNLFLWPAQTYPRKLVEALLTVLFEGLLPKRRILELYLNIVQLDHDLFGAEAAARRFFGKPAAGLTAAEAARLVAVLPNPVYYRAADPSPEVLRREAFALERMEELGMRYLDLLDGRTFAFIRWAVRDFLQALKPPQPWRALQASVESAPGERDPFLYAAVVNQFRVESNPRYARNRQGLDETYCNIFAWDVTRAMGAEIPHWVDPAGNPAPDGVGRELDANGLVDWLERHGPAHGWGVTEQTGAQELANRGCPVVAVWNNPGGIGHVAVVRPGELSGSEGPTIAQSGAVNFNVGTIEQGFLRTTKGREVIYYWHK